MPGAPSEAEILQLHSLDAWPWAQPVNQTPPWGTDDGGVCPEGSPWTGSLGDPGGRGRGVQPRQFLKPGGDAQFTLDERPLDFERGDCPPGQVCGPFGELEDRYVAGDEPGHSFAGLGARVNPRAVTLEQYFGVKGLGSALGFPPAIAAAAAAIAAIAGAAGGIATGIGAVIENLKKLERQEIKDARAAGATTKEIMAIRKGYRKRKKKERQKARAVKQAARRKKRPGRKPSRRRARRKPSRKRKRKARKRRPKVTDQEIDALRFASGAEQAAAGTQMAADILARISAGVVEIETGVSRDPVTGEPTRAVVRREAAEVAAAEEPAGVMVWLKKEAFAGVPRWGVGVGVLVLAGGAMMMRRR